MYKENFEADRENMNLHEYQAKKILRKRGVPIPDFGIASSTEEVKEIINQLDLDEAVVKIQVHAGGRGKAGGVKFAKSKEEIIDAAEKLIGMKMVNNQTGPEGVVAHKVLITRPVDIKKEYYIGAVIDRATSQPILIASPEGGMEIEEIAEKSPEKILKIAFGRNGRIPPYLLHRLIKFMGWEKDTAKEGAMVAEALAKSFIETDGDLLEINPLVETEEGKLWLVDAKLSIDDNALFRQSEIVSYYDPSQLSHSEAQAKEFDLSYIAMDGNIGCMVNGAGLAMATMDIIKLFGGTPANFLDVGGGASKDQISAGFRIILSDPKVKAILVNIFGGILNCETLAEGVLHAVKELKMHVPLVIRMEGTNVEKARKMIGDSKLDIITAIDLNDAAKKAVEEAGKK